MPSLDKRPSIGAPRGGEFASAVEGLSFKQPRYHNSTGTKRSFCVKKMCSSKLRHAISESPCAGRSWRKLSVSEAGKVLVTLYEPRSWDIGVLG